MTKNEGPIKSLNDPRLKPLRIRAMRRELCKRRLHDYLKIVVWPVIEPATVFNDNWHIGYLCEYLEAVTLGQILRLCINMPPRELKSILCTVSWPTWEWIERPSLKVASASYSDDLALEHSRLRRQIITSPIYQELYGNRFSLVRDNNQAGEFKNDKSGVMLATSVGGTFTGKGANRILLDDITSPKQAESTVERLKGIDFYRHTAYTRLNDRKRDAIIFVMQRLHNIDLTSFVKNQENEGNFTFVCLEAAVSKRKTYFYPLSGRQHTLEENQVFDEERLPWEVLNDITITLGSRTFQAQYMQNPSQDGGNNVKNVWFNYFNALPKSPEFADDYIMSWDMAFKDLKTSSYVVGQVWALFYPNVYLIDQVREQMDTPTTIQALKSLMEKYPLIRNILIEDKANGPAIMQTLRKEIPGLIAVKTDSTTGGKMARLLAQTSYMEAGNVFLECTNDPSEYNNLPHSHRTKEEMYKIVTPNYVKDFIDELCIFPDGDHDDQVDACSQALVRLLGPNRRSLIDSKKTKTTQQRRKHANTTVARTIKGFTY